MKKTFMSVYVHQNISCPQQDSCAALKANMMFTLFPKRYLQWLLRAQWKWVWKLKWPALASSQWMELNPGSTKPLLHLFPVVKMFFATHACTKMHFLQWNISNITKSTFADWAECLANSWVKSTSLKTATRDPSADARYQSMNVMCRLLFHSSQKEPHVCTYRWRMTLQP